jgi:hypothetical protein
VEAGYGLLVQDLHKLHLLSSICLNAIGSPVDLNSAITSSVWQGISLVNHAVTAVSSPVAAHTTTIASMSDHQLYVTQSLTDLELSTEDTTATLLLKVSSCESNLHALESRVFKLIPLLTQLKRGVQFILAHQEILKLYFTD